MAGGAYIFLGAVIGIFLIVAFSYYTRTGSAINQRPRGAGRGDAQHGATGSSRISSAGRDDAPPPDWGS